jgi:hypothetical protein
VLPLLLAGVCGWGCDRSAGDDAPDGGVDAANPGCDPLGDDDEDGIPNEVEGCFENRDTDGDGVPDYVDLDADHDGVPDAVEANWGLGGETPVDTDGDGAPDYVDPDSDDDGLDDFLEDRDCDGRLGQCVDPCDPQALDPCGDHRFCNPVRGLCVDERCLGAETDPLVPDTDGDGLLDADELIRICDQGSESYPHLRRLSGSDLLITLPEDCALDTLVAADGTVTTFDCPPNSGNELFGFGVVRATRGSTASEEATALVQELDALLPLGVSVLPTADGTATWIPGAVASDDAFGGVRLTLSATATWTLGDLRSAMAEVAAGPFTGSGPAPNGLEDTEFRVGLFTLRADPLIWDSDADPTPAAMHVVVLARAVDVAAETPQRHWLLDFAWGAAMGYVGQCNQRVEFECEGHPAASELTLSHFPVAPSLTVGVERVAGGQTTVETLPRSAISGYSFAHTTNTLHLAPAVLGPSATRVVVAYRHYAFTMVPCD